MGSSLYLCHPFSPIVWRVKTTMVAHEAGFVLPAGPSAGFSGKKSLVVEGHGIHSVCGGLEELLRLTLYQMVERQGQN